MKQFESCAKWMLDHCNDDQIFNHLCDELSVMAVAELDSLCYEDNPMIESWFAFCNTDGIIAYFGDETEAFVYRLDYMDRIVNYIWEFTPFADRDQKVVLMKDTLSKIQELKLKLVETLN
jgi:hypothetical protein